MTQTNWHVAGPKKDPPNYRKATKPGECCGTCEMFWKGHCWGYGNAEVEAEGVCDSWSKDTGHKTAELFGDPYPGETPQKQEDWANAAPSSDVPWPDIDPAMWYRINGEDVDLAPLPMKGGQPIYVHQGTAYVGSDHPGLVEWAGDSNLRLAEYPGGGEMVDRKRHQEDLEMFNRGDTDWQPPRDNPDVEPRGPFACSQCDYKPSDLADYRMHVEYEHYPREEEIQDGHFPQIEDFDAPLPLRRNQPKPNGGETVARVGSHNLGWFPGELGKGWLLPDGTVHTWPVSKTGLPHHADVLLGRGIDPSLMPTTNQQTGEWQTTPTSAFPFMISHEGEVFQQGSGDPLDGETMARLRGVSSEFRAPRRRATVVRLPDDRACYQIPQFETYSKLAGFNTPSTVYYGAFDDGDLVGYGVVREDGEPEVMMIQAKEHGRGVGTAILRRIKRDYGRFYTHADSFAGERLMRREGVVNVKGHLWRYAQGKDPKDMLEAQVPFVYDIGKDKLVLGYPGYDTHDVTSPQGFTPAGIVEGTYEPGGKVTIWTASTMPWTVRHLMDLWKAQAPQMEVTSVEAKELDGSLTKLAGYETQAVGPYMNALVQSEPAAANAYGALSAKGGEVYVVGGAVRDYMQGKTPKDVDLLVRGLPGEEVMHTLRQLPGGVNLTGKRFGVYRYHAGDPQHDVEIALPRTDKYEGGNRAKAEITVNHELPVEKDLERRDFTANAMAVRLDDGTLVDPFNGAHDIQRGVLRTTNPNSFHEDPTRLVRALTAYSRFGLTPDERTRLEMRKYAHMLQHESPDTLSKVLDKWMGAGNPAAGVRLAHETGVLKYLFPEVDDHWDFDQRNPYHNLPLGEHLVHTLDNVSRLTSDPDVRLAALLHDIGKPASQWIDDNGVGHYYRVDDKATGESKGQYHESVGAHMADALMRRRFNWPAARTTRISELVRRHMFPPFNDDVGARKFMNKHQVYGDDLLHLREADQAGKGQTPEEMAARTQVGDMRQLVEQQREMGAPVQQAAMAINGNDILNLGLKPGPAVGQVLQFLTNAVVENPELNTREQLLPLAQQQIDALPLETRATA